MMKKSELGPRDLWVTMKYINICIMGILEGKERQKEAESLFGEIMPQTSQIQLKTLIYTSCTCSTTSILYRFTEI